MRNLLIHLSLFLFSMPLFAQPVNDDCSGVINLGVGPVCNSSDIYDNVDATPSDIGFGNIPANFNGGVINHDVWFSFTTPADLENFKITIFASSDGSNNPIQNPQVALYRGSCQVDGLSELISASAANGGSLVQLSILGLTPNTTYFIRVDDYSATAAANWGDFTICIEEYIPNVIMGEETMSSACSGTLFDSGGPDEDYQSNEDLTFTICPNEAHSCITLDLVEYSMESGFDHLDIHSGNAITNPLIGSVSGASTGDHFNIFIESSCVTLHFISDGSAEQSGFQLDWQCSPAECGGASFDDPIVINSMPYTDDASTCDGGINSTVVPCTGQLTGGASVIYQFTTDGGFCASIASTNGTGVYVLDGHPDDPATSCLGESNTGGFAAFNFESAGTYYIVVASQQGCADFTLTMEETMCSLSPALEDALCNPLNGCVQTAGVPSVFVFEQGFQDMEIEPGVNAGCWLGLGFEPDFYWFTIQASNDGNFGFILQGANGVQSDIDINVWGPFDPIDACENKEIVTDYIRNNQPIRSTYAPGNIHTGLVDIHPDLGIAVTDAFDCGDPVATPGAGGDDFISTIPVLAGEVYVVLINDFGDGIADNGVSIDWGPSTPGVLDTVPLITSNILQDTAICPGQPLLLGVNTSIEDIVWTDPNGNLSCTECPNPIATVSETTTFQATVNAVCYSQTVNIKVNVIEAIAGDDITVCLNEDIELSAGSTYDFVDYAWTEIDGLTFSCTDCPNPTVVAAAPGTYTLTVSVVTPLCSDSDELVVTVLPQEAPAYTVSDDISLCIGETTDIGQSNPSAGLTFNWTSNPEGFSSMEPNPFVTPTETTTYYVMVENNICPNPSLDSVEVQVNQMPIISVRSDTTICVGESLILGNTEEEDGVTYIWQGPGEFDDNTSPNTVVYPTSSGVFTLVAQSGACQVEAAVNINVVDFSIEINHPDTVGICRGETILLQPSVTPEDAVTQWLPITNTLSAQSGNDIVATPESSITYIGEVGVEGCFRFDTLFVKVDSLPDLSIMADPEKDVYCEGDQVILSSPSYPSYQYPEIMHQWLGGPGMESPDSLYNLVLTLQDTFNYQRITTIGACIDTSELLINVDKVPVLEVLPADTTVCPGAPVQITTIYNGRGTLSWEYDMTTGVLGTDQFQPLAIPASTMNISVTSDDNCPASTGLTINTEFIALPVTLTATPEVLISGSTIVLSADVSGFDPGTPFIYEWFMEGQSIGTTSVPTFTVTNVQSEEFAVHVSKGDGCPGAANTTVTIVNIDVPNVFTPNNDGTNDILKLYYPDLLTVDIKTFSVYNRWGQIVFESNNNAGWDGTFKGKPAASDVYIFHIIGDSNGAIVDKSGEITLLR